MDKYEYLKPSIPCYCGMIVSISRTCIAPTIGMWLDSPRTEEKAVAFYLDSCHSTFQEIPYLGGGGMPFLPGTVLPNN